LVSDPQAEAVVESTADRVGSDRPGVQDSTWKKFVAEYREVVLLRVKGVTKEQAARVVAWAEARKGRPFRWPAVDGTNKNDDARMYCAQLVWIAYKRELNIDLDAFGAAVIHPDSIYNSPHVHQIDRLH
jgi:uncharacterized protein YycO